MRCTVHDIVVQLFNDNKEILLSIKAWLYNIYIFIFIYIKDQKIIFLQL